MTNTKKDDDKQTVVNNEENDETNVIRDEEIDDNNSIDEIIDHRERQLSILLDVYETSYSKKSYKDFSEYMEKKNDYNELLKDFE